MLLFYYLLKKYNKKYSYYTFIYICRIGRFLIYKTMKDFKAGQKISQGHYTSFQPNFINRDWAITDMELLNLLSIADRQLGRLDMYSEYVNIDLFVSMHIAKEATQSSKIEGTMTTIEEAFLSEKNILREKRDDWGEVQNYINAMNEAVQMLEKLPLSARLIKNAHKILMRNVRGENKMPGEFRTSQNWIGGASINDAVFIPPAQNTLAELISDIEKFANDPQNPMPDILKIALIHYRFETVHPFLDGNGRVGRLLITLYFVSKGILKQPILYLSDFFERHRILYYDNLMRVRTHNDMGQWFKFFLTGITETAKSGIDTFDSILQLKNSAEQKIKSLGSKTGDAAKVLDALYRKPVTDAARVAEVIEKTPTSAYRLISELERLKILKEITGGKRGRVYVFQDYMDLFEVQ